MAESKAPVAAGLDTSVVLRLLVGEPKNQADVALQYVRDLFAENQPAIVSDQVIAETYFALHAHYGVPKRESVRTLLQFVDSDLVALEGGGCAREVLVTMSASTQKPGLVDRLIHAQYLKQADEVATFEKALGKLEKVTVLRSN